MRPPAICSRSLVLRPTCHDPRRVGLSAGWDSLRGRRRPRDSPRVRHRGAGGRRRLRALAIAFVAARGVALALSAWMTQALLGGSGCASTALIWRNCRPRNGVRLPTSLTADARRHAATSRFPTPRRCSTRAELRAHRLTRLRRPWPARTAAGAARRRRIDGAGRGDRRRRVPARDAAHDVALRRRLRGRGAAVSYSVGRPRVRLRDLGAARDRDFGQPRAAAADDRHHRTRGQRRFEPLSDPAPGASGAAIATVAGEASAWSCW